MKNPGIYLALISLPFLLGTCTGDGAKKDDIMYRVGILGAPSKPDIEWNDQNIKLMKDLGFNAMQLNIAWGYRPGDDPLNLEDVLPVPDKYKLPVDIDSTLNKNTGSSTTFIHSPRSVAGRAAELKKRIGLCEKYGMRSIFHFGAPFVEYPAIEPLSQCISDSMTLERYVTLIRNFHKEFPGVDDLLMYTYDQNAWLCSEDGECKHCSGVPLDKRVTAFVNKLAQTWHELNPEGRLWWEPWEISGGQTYKAVEMLDAECVGLSIHSSITEVQLALSADRWFKNMLTLAEKRNIPVIGESWLGGATEETEPYLSIPTPLVTLRALRAMDKAGKLSGMKEYYGNLPGREDVNLRTTSIFFNDKDITDKAALDILAKPYGKAEEKVKSYWTSVSEAFEIYPWDISWYAREVGKSQPEHALTAATLKGASWVTPSWLSNRRAAFMRTVESDYPHFWMMEDAQLRFETTASLMDKALETAAECRKDIPENLLKDFDDGVCELKGFRQRVLSYAYHIRETNLVNIMRHSLQKWGMVKDENVQELKSLLIRDMQNQQTERKDMEDALQMLNNDLHRFLNTYFQETTVPGNYEVWTITSK